MDQSDKIIQLRQELKDELTGNILPFWMSRAIDEKHGGFVGHIASNGEITQSANKGAVLNARILWTFSAACRIFGKDAYRKTADRAYQYFSNYFIDPVHGGVYWEINYLGEPVNDRKQIYAIAFAIYGLSEYYRITSDEDALDLAKELNNAIEKYSFDQARNGYFEAFARDWSPLADRRLSAKDQNENKTMNTHLHILEAYTNLYRVWKDDLLQQRLINLVQLFMDRFINAEGHLNLFFDDDWNLKSDLVSFGHDIECSWLLQEAAEVSGDKMLIDKSRQLALRIAGRNRKGLDQDGGLFYEYFPSENRWDTDKHWWPQAEALVGYFNAFQVSGRQEFLDIALNGWAFIKRFLIDRENGEWHWSVDRAGNPNTKEQKAGFWKCPYHNGRACMEIWQRTGQ